MIDFPKTIQIQTTNWCTSKCCFCPTGIGKPDHKEMSREFCEKIIDQCIGKGVEAVMPFVNNEPLTWAYTSMLGDYVKEMLPNTRYCIYTNAQLASLSMIVHVTDYIHFSIGGASRETYFKTCGVDCYNDVVRLIREFLKLYTKEYTINMTVTKANEHEKQAFIDYWKSVGVPEERIGVHGVVNRNRAFQGCVDNKSQLDRACSSPFNDLFVDTDGKCILCCEDGNSECIVGDLNKQSIEEVWNGEEYKKYRQLHLDGRKREIPLCRDCNNFR